MSNASISTHAGLRIYSKIVSACTLFLIFAGAMVTSHDAGLAVPDWPLSYGMVFPPMVGGVFYEHGHRLIASTVGFMTVILTIWVWKIENRKWVKNLALAALGLVIVQGLLGGLTVLFFLPTSVSTLHAMTGQSFFVVTIILAYSLSREFGQLNFSDRCQNLYKAPLVFVAVLYVQLFLGAWMRHSASGLARRQEASCVLNGHMAKVSRAKPSRSSRSLKS